MVNAHRRRNSLTRIKINGSWLTEEIDIKERMVQAFQTLLFDSEDWRPNIDVVLFERIEA